MRIKEAFMQMSKTVSNAMKNPFFVIAGLERDLKEISENISLIEYSTSECLVGKWIDGSNLYEMTYIVNSGITFGGTYNYVTLPNNIKVRDYKGFISRNNGALDGFIYGFQGMSGSDISSLDVRTNSIEFSVQSALESGFEYVSITIQYTKSA